MGGENIKDIITDSINQYKKKYPEIINEQGNNVIYYEPNFGKRPSEIYEDAEIFKNETNGAFILVMNIRSLELVLGEMIKLKTSCKFDIICTGGASEEVFNTIKELGEEYENLFKRGCLFTYNPPKYKHMINRFPLIKGVYLKNEEVLDFLRENAKSTSILRTLKLVTIQDYFNKVIKIHGLIAKHYGNFSIDNYTIEIEKVKYFIDNPGEYTIRILDEFGQQRNQKETMLQTLELYKDIENNYKDIIKNYTSENCSVYKDFNYLLLRLNERGIEAFGYFIAGLIYSLNKFYKITGNGVESDINLYRGMRLDISELLNYERYENAILCFPSFTSTSKTLENAGRITSVPTRKQQGLFSVFIEIEHKYRRGSVPNGINIESIAQFQSESETLFLPFSFFKIKKVSIDLENFECDIKMENISRKVIFEERMQKGYEINPESDLLI